MCGNCVTLLMTWDMHATDQQQHWRQRSFTCRIRQKVNMLLIPSFNITDMQQKPLVSDPNGILEDRVTLLGEKSRRSQQ